MAVTYQGNVGEWPRHYNLRWVLRVMVAHERAEPGRPWAVQVRLLGEDENVTVFRAATRLRAEMEAARICALMRT